MTESSVQTTSPPKHEPELRTQAMPEDTNAAGDIFGGWLLSQMDLAGAMYAAQQIHGRVATVGIEAMSFHRPVFVGDRVSCYCTTSRVGRTSLTVHVDTWVRRRCEQEGFVDIQVTEGQLTFVALNADGSKRDFPEHVPARSFNPTDNC